MRQNNTCAKPGWEASPLPTVLVLGVGNILMGDEGVGVHVIRELQRREVMACADIVDGGTGILDLLNTLADRDKVIIIDAVRGGSNPGAVYRFTLNDIETQRQSNLSLHQISLVETFRMAQLLGRMPHQIVIFGIEPKKVDWGLELSPEVAAAVPKVIELLQSELGGVKT